MKLDLMNQFLTDLTSEEAATIAGGRRGRGADDTHQDDHRGGRGRRGKRRRGRRRRNSDDGPNHT